MSDFLLELRSEEIPARMQAGARAELEKLFRREMDAAGVATGDVTVWSTPRRLALIARGLPEQTEASETEIKGPRVGAPDQAIDGFLRRYLKTREDLNERNGIYYLNDLVAGRPMPRVLQEAIPAIIDDFSWPKSMRWGAASISTESARWVRPLSGIVAILGEDLVACDAAGVASGYATHGHRFHCPGEVTIGGAHDYAEKLRACHVIVDHEERQDIIREQAARVAADAGLTLVEDEGLVVENAGLTEWPVPLLGRFDEAFLDVPPEVIQLTARVNQKYFVCTSSPAPAGEGDQPQAGGGVAPYAAEADPSTTSWSPSPSRLGEDRLANAFVCTANIVAEDGGAAIVDGNRKVLAARLSDARFFWEQDRKTPLADQAKKLERITFHEKLGTVADKVERVAKLARWLVEQEIVKPTSVRPEPVEGPHFSSEDKDGASTSSAPTVEELADLAEQAARLCKADLVTEMVGEFPELQGLMGGYYARAEGLPDAVADAIRDHYKPVGQGDEVPTAPVTVAVSLADKLDTLFAFFSWDMAPTGSKDPFALRRAGLAVIALLIENKIRLSMIDVFLERARTEWVSDREMETARNELRLLLRDDDSASEDGLGALLQWLTLKNVADFFADRLKVQQREAGVRHDLIDAVFALGGEDDLVRLLARVHALQAFMATEDGANLLAGYKRAANILKKEDWPENPSLIQGRGRSAEGAEGVGDARTASPASHHPPTPSSEEDGEMPHTGDEDPLENVDDPDMRAVYAAAAEDAATRGAQKTLSYTPEPAEKALIEALDAAEPRAVAAIAAEDFAAAMSALASLRAPIDRFFEDVIVNAEEEAKRTARLDLLARFRDAVHRVADFSRIEG